jgi:hypothetical protein
MNADAPVVVDKTISVPISLALSNASFIATGVFSADTCSNIFIFLPPNYINSDI